MLSVSHSNQVGTVIEIPPYLSAWDVEEEAAIALRAMTGKGVPCIIDMRNVKDVYSSTVRLIMKVYARARYLECPVYIIANDKIRSILFSLQINQKIPVFSEFFQFGSKISTPSHRTVGALAS